MPESVENWWKRRQRSKGAAVPYAVGTYRSEWTRYPVLVRQFHPDLNGFIVLTQIPPAAEVYLLWQCDSGHRFVATPGEQRNRPDRTRRRSTWCPDCTASARNRSPQHPSPAAGAGRKAPSQRRRYPRAPTRATPAPGAAFYSAAAPLPASAAEADLRQRIAARLDVDLSANAISVRRPFHDRLEVWPDLVIPELMVAIEYDTTGRTSTEHVGGREASDRTKDRLLREVGWEVVRIRCSNLQPLGPWDVRASGVTAKLVDRVIHQLGAIRGVLIVSAYSKEPRSGPSGG